MIIEIPGRRPLKINNIVFDLNGTLALDGVIDDGVRQRLEEVTKLYNCYIITAGTHGNIDEIRKIIDIHIETIDPGRESEQKRLFVAGLGAHETIAVGNGANDRSMLEEAELGIAICGREGMCAELIRAADIVVCDIMDVLGMLLNTDRIVATLRS